MQANALRNQSTQTQTSLVLLIAQMQDDLDSSPVLTGGGDETTSGRSSAGHAEYVECSFNIFTQDHPLRARCIAMISNPYPGSWEWSAVTRNTTQTRYNAHFFAK